MLETVAIFIDGSNFYHGLKTHALPTRLDFHKLARRLCGDRRLLRLYYYNATLDKGQDPERYKDQQRFFSMLQKTDYVTVRLGRLVYRGNPPEPLEKGVDIKIAVDMLMMAHRDNYDTAILVSGDGDFADVLVAIKDLGKHIETAYFARGHADVLKQVADRVVTLTDEVIRDCAL